MEKGRIVNEWTRQEFSQLTEKELKSYELRPVTLEERYIRQFSDVSKSGDKNSADQRNRETGIDGDELLCLTDFYFTYTPRKYLFVKKKLTPEDEEICDLRIPHLQIEKGKIVGVIGDNGSGKSTLLHTIAGVDVPTSGKVFLDGQDVYAGSNEKLAIFRRRQVGLVYQFHNLIPTLNVVENITLPILMDKRKVNKERLQDLLELLGLQERKTHLPNQLSGGQQQRVAIGRALMNAPQVCLADEPTGSLDSRNGQEIIHLLKESHRKYHQTLIVVTHDETIALQADRIITIADGKVLRDERQVTRS